MGMGPHKSLRGNLAVPPRDFLVFAWRYSFRTASVTQRECGVTQIGKRLPYFFASSVESFSFPWHCYVTHFFYYGSLAKNMINITHACDLGHEAASVKQGRRIAFRGG
jgi:hypothetical protein